MLKDSEFVVHYHQQVLLASIGQICENPRGFKLEISSEIISIVSAQNLTDDFKNASLADNLIYLWRLLAIS